MKTTRLRESKGALRNKTKLQLPQALTSQATQTTSGWAGSMNAYCLSLYSACHPLRPGLEDYIAQRYARRHQAAISNYLPHLLALKNGRRTVAALGLNSALKQTLFLEAYLDKPVEQAISQQLCIPVDRARVVEIGNLAATQRTASTLLFTLLSALLDQAGYRWIVFTATPYVQALVISMGFSLQAISEAKAERINAASKWGTYYDAHPQVMVGCIDEAMRQALSPTLREWIKAHRQSINTIASRV